VSERHDEDPNLQKARTMKYRAEIDGLRTVAVVPVVLFHAGWEVFSGGYVGVDVFFVISGFLITSIIIGERAEGRFSILRFYERRARRILPALFIVLAATLPFAWAWMPPDAFEDFLRSLAFAALFISNVHFWEYSGYFAQASEMRPLLHTWSLAVEEQYYLLFPLLMAALGAFSRRKHIVVIGVLAFLSLALSEWGWRNYPEENFFFTFSRMWELFAGSLCAFIAFRRELRGSHILSLIGMGMILWSVFAYDASVPFPSVYTLVPVVGTALVLLFAQQGTAVAWVLSRKLPVAIGLISYSAYLWHQPLLAFARIRSLHEPSLWLMSGLALASFALAALTWRYVEQPFRSGPHRMLLPTRPALFGASLAGIAAFASFGFTGLASDWSNARLASKMTPFYSEFLQSTQGMSHPEGCTGFGDVGQAPQLVCPVNDYADATQTIAVFGDSHADAILPAFEAYAESSQANVVKMGVAGCPPLLGVYVWNGNYALGVCHAAAEAQAKFVQENDISAVVLVARWSLYTQAGYEGHGRHYLLNDENALQTGGPSASRAVFEAAVRRTAEFYNNLGVELLVVEQVPQLIFEPKNIVYAAMFQNRTGEDALRFFHREGLSYEKHNILQDYNVGIFKSVETLRLVSFADVFDRDGAYRWMLDGQSAYQDGNHLSAFGARMLRERLKAELETALKRASEG
jgi:peptidoglycan/LPS O-acetylase OafA/YrhL